MEDRVDGGELHPGEPPLHSLRPSLASLLTLLAPLTIESWGNADSVFTYLEVLVHLCQGVD